MFAPDGESETETETNVAETDPISADEAQAQAQAQEPQDDLFAARGPETVDESLFDLADPVEQ
jgi:hypothetical protein